MSEKLTYQNIRIDKWEIGLSLLTEKKIKEVRGYLSRQFGDVTFKITFIEMEDGSKIDVEGEHDFPYLSIGYDENVPNMDDETLERLCDEQDETE